MVASSLHERGDKIKTVGKKRKLIRLDIVAEGDEVTS
jgi:hypothetical protein